MELFNVLNSYQLSFEVLIDPIVELLNRSDEVDHHQIKVEEIYFDIYIH